MRQFESDEAGGRELLPRIKFVKVAYFEIETEVKGKEVTLKIAEFQMPLTAEFTKIASKVKDPGELSGSRAIYWDYSKMV